MQNKRSPDSQDSPSGVRYRMQRYKDTLAGKVALVTGGSSGIGKATAKLLAYAGAKVAVLSTAGAEVQATCDEIRHAGADALMVVADVSDAVQMERALKQVKDAWQRLDIVVANAGINGLWAPLEEISPDEWDRTLNVNLRGTFLSVKYSLPLLKLSGGSVVIVSSVNGTRVFSNSGRSAYAVSKAGQLAFGRMMALELAQYHIRVNTICPGTTATQISETTTAQNLVKVRQSVEFPAGTIPLTQGKIGTSGQVAQLIWFLASDASNHITGTEVFIDGGESLLQG